MSGIVPPPTSASWAVPGSDVKPVVNPVPDDSRPQVAQLGRRKSARDQPQDALERLGREIVKRIGRAHQVEERRHVPRLHRHACDHLLGQHVEAIVGNPQRLDFALQHRTAQRGGLEQVARRLGDQPPLAHASDHVPGTTDALQSASDAAGRLDLANQVDRPHVDAEFERCRRNDRRNLAGLQRLFRRPPFGKADAAVMSAERRPPSPKARLAGSGSGAPPSSTASGSP